MDKRIIIESVFIKNFRSIRSELIIAKNFNIFVGLNDAGKSNFLKALNLYFNNQTDYNTPFNFKNDFTYLFPKSSHSTKEILIKIKFKIPDSYKESGIYTWEKRWRTDNYYAERITNDKGDEPSSRSRVPSTLIKIRYRYVPAVKSADYYKTLLADLYTAVSSSLNNPLLTSTKTFSDSLKQHTKSITQNVSQRLHLNSELSVPSNLSDIFKSLIFITKSGTIDSISVPLNSRGDGIQARHIPIILKYIAEEDQRSRNQGSMKISTIWGFEEPENGLELSRAFELAKEFTDYSREIQIFTSTHSPAFYMEKNTEGTTIYFVSKKENSDETSFNHDSTSKDISKNMGLMPIIAPFIAEQESKLKMANAIINQNFLTDINTIMVEGKTDKLYLLKAIETISPELNKMIQTSELRILTKDSGCGTTQLRDWAIAWTYTGFKSKLYVLFDKDKAGENAKTEIENDPVFKNRRTSGGGIKIQYIKPSDIVVNVLSKVNQFTYQIEHLLPLEIWGKFKVKNFTVPRDQSELYDIFQAHLCLTKALDNTIDDIFGDSLNIRDTIITLNIDKNKKTKAFDFAQKESTHGVENVYSGFKRTIEDLEKTFIQIS